MQGSQDKKQVRMEYRVRGGKNTRGGEIFRTRPYQPWGPPTFLYNGYRVSRGGKAAGAWC
jgi:hypothetical protein